MKRMFKNLIIFSLLLFCLTGCWSRRELNELAIVVGLGVDVVDDQYIVSTQVVDPSEIAVQQAGGRRAPVVTYVQKAETIFEAIRKITTIAPRKLYFSHLRIVVIGKGMAEKGIGELVDFLYRDHELRTDFFIVVTKDSKARSVLEVLTSLESIPANNLFESLLTSERAWASTMTITLDQLVGDLLKKGIEPNLSRIEVVGNKEIGDTEQNVKEVRLEAHLQYFGMAALKEDKLVGWFNEDESKGLNYVLNRVKSTIVPLPCFEEKDKEIDIEIVRTKSNVKIKREKDQLKASIQFHADGNIASVNCKKMDLMTKETIKNLEKEAEKVIKNSIEASVKRAQEDFKADYFGFGEVLRRKDKKYWKKVKDDWNETFANIPIDVQVDVKIWHTGKIGNPALSEEIK